MLQEALTEVIALDSSDLTARRQEASDTKNKSAQHLGGGLVCDVIIKPNDNITGFDGYNNEITGSISKTLNSASTDYHHVPVVVLNDQVSSTLRAQSHQHEPVLCYGIDHVITTGGNCTAKGDCIYEEIQATLKAGGTHAVCADQQVGKDATEKCLNPWDIQCYRVFGANSICDCLCNADKRCGGSSPNICYKAEEEEETFCQNQGIRGDTPIVTYTLDPASSNSMKSSNPHSGIRETDVARCLDTFTHDPSCNQGGNVVVYRNGGFGEMVEGQPCLRSSGGDLGGGSEAIIVRYCGYDSGKGL